MYNSLFLEMIQLVYFSCWNCYAMMGIYEYIYISTPTLAGFSNITCDPLSFYQKENIPKLTTN